MPFFIYLTNRYYFYSYILLCKCCCGKKKKGRIEKFKEDFIVKFLSKKHTKIAFMRYCLEKEDISDELKQKVKEYKKKKKGEIEKILKKKKSMKKNAKVFPKNNESERLMKEIKEETHPGKKKNL